MIAELEKNNKNLQYQLEEKEKQLQEAQNMINVLHQQNYQQQQTYNQKQIYSQPLIYSEPLYPQSSYSQQPQQQYALSQSQLQPVLISQHPPQNNPIPHNHPILNGVLTNNKKCYICEKKGINQPCYTCQQCVFDICQSCCNKIFEALHKKIHPHPLMLTKNEIDCQCNICNKNINGDFSMNCNICNYYFCKDCFLK